MGTAAELVEDHILAMIRSGELAPGEHVAHLPLARRLGVSNNPVIQALRKLEGRGILERLPDGSARVRDFSAREIYAALALREAVEGVAARFCAENATDEELAVLRVRYDRMVEAYHRGDYAPGEEWAFHEGIAEFSHTPFLEHLYDTLGIVRHTFTLRLGHKSAQELIERHAPIMEAILRRDGIEAEAAARRHVAEAREAYWKEVMSREGECRGVGERRVRSGGKDLRAEELRRRS